MKQLNEQFRRMQQLAGLITENFDEGLLMTNSGESITFGDITPKETYVVIGDFGNFKKGNEIKVANINRRADGEIVITFKNTKTGETDTVMGSPDETINVSSMVNEIKVETPAEIAKNNLKDAIKAEFPKIIKDGEVETGTDEWFDLLALAVKAVYGVDIKDPFDTFLITGLENTPYWEKIQGNDYVDTLETALTELEVGIY